MTRLDRLLHIYERRYQRRGLPVPLTLAVALVNEGALLTDYHEDFN